MSVTMSIRVPGGGAAVLAAVEECPHAYVLPQILDELDEIARAEGLAPLGGFVQLDGDELDEMAAAMEEAGLEVPAFDRPDPAAWHAADRGLTTVRGLLAHIDAHPELVEERWANRRRIDAEDIVPELEAFEACLSVLASHGTPFRIDHG